MFLYYCVMDIQTEQQRLIRANEILEAIEAFKTKIRLEKDYISNWSYMFGVVTKSENRIDTLERCIKRLEGLYRSILK